MEVNIGLGQMVLAFVAAMGIPSAIMGLIIWRLERRIDKREKEQAAQEQGQKDLFVQCRYCPGGSDCKGRPAHPRRPL